MYIIISHESDASIFILAPILITSACCGNNNNGNQNNNALLPIDTAAFKQSIDFARSHSAKDKTSVHVQAEKSDWVD